ncbi:MAG: Ig-like domain-containing protein, partial [Oscillospiraceae bacterium]|nr:Ig-like domain-containing protein [Oscillospiraceae bacterium]
MDEQNKQKKSPAKIIALILCALVLTAAAVTAIFLLQKKEPPPDIPDKIEIELKSTEAIESTEATLDDTPILLDFVVADMTVVSAFGLDIVPTKNTPGGIALDTEFVIKTAAPLKTTELRSCIFLDGADTGYEIRESVSEGEYILKPTSPLKYDAVYNIEYAPKDVRPVSFAFQTIENFKVAGTIPGNNGYNVPLNSGIEIKFNEEIAGDFKDYFSISPYVNGIFENVGLTYIFIPDGLAPGLNYTITIKNGLKSAESERILEEDYIFRFQTTWGDGGDYLGIRGDIYETFLPDDEVFVELYAGGALLAAPCKAEAYKLKTAEDYLNAADLLDSPEFLSGLDCVLSLETELLTIELSSYSKTHYVMLDQTLPSGWYVIKITAQSGEKEYELHKFIQVSPLSVYSVSVGGEVLFWINDASTGLPAVKAEITAGATKAVTDGEGLAIMDTAAKSREHITIKYADYPEFAYTANLRAPAVLEARNRYYSYINTDRRAYRPNDTIDVFGTIRARYDEYQISPDDIITLEIGNMIKIPVTLDKYGSFGATIPIKDMLGYLELKLCFNGETIGGSYLNIVDYDNAKYIVAAKTDRLTYRPGETAEVVVSAEFYDGTFVEGLEVTSDNRTLGTTDSEGKAKIGEFIQKSPWARAWQPYVSSFYYNIGKTENKIQYAYVPYLLITSDIMLEHEIVSDGKIAFSASFIDRAAIENSIENSIEESWTNLYSMSMSPDLYRGDIADLNFVVDIHKYETIRTKTGEKYDNIKKINVPTYEYTTQDTVIKTHNLHTTDGKAEIEGLPVSDDAYIRYYVTITYSDTEDNPVEFSVWYEGYALYSNESSIKNYYFALYNKDGENTYSLKPGESAYVKLLDNYNTQETTEGKILAFLYHGKNKIISTNIGAPDGTPVAFTTDCIYNVYVLGAYFDGRHIYPIIYGAYISYDFSEKMLEFDFSFDKDSYLPGDEVNVEIKVADSAQNPKKALVNISVVDESAFAEYDNTPNMPANFYGSIFYYAGFEYYASYNQHEFSYGDPDLPDAAAMGGGGGDDYAIRKDFTDNPAFLSVETDESGIAKLNFKLSDQITSWRVTAHGITEDNCVGNAKENIISSLPFAIGLVMSDEYTEGDEIFVIAKPQGSAYRYNQTDITYTVQIIGGDGGILASETKTSKNIFAFDVGKLPEGSYAVRVVASALIESEILQDGMEKNFEVVKSGVRLPLIAYDVVSEESPALRAYDIKTSPVILTIGNYDMDFVMKTLYSCMEYGSNRTDNIAAGAFARKFTDSVYAKTPLDISHLDYQAANLYASRGMGELLYADPDLLYTARFYACFPESIMDENKPWLRDYVYNAGCLYIENTKGVKNMTP